jgi:hypothetical protein
MVGMPTMSCFFFRGLEPRIVMPIMPAMILTMIMLMLNVLIMMLIVLIVKLLIMPS